MPRRAAAPRARRAPAALAAALAAAVAALLLPGPRPAAAQDVAAILGDIVVPLTAPILSGLAPAVGQAIANRPRREVSAAAADREPWAPPDWLGATAQAVSGLAKAMREEPGLNGGQQPPYPPYAYPPYPTAYPGGNPGSYALPVPQPLQQFQAGIGEASDQAAEVLASYQEQLEAYADMVRALQDSNSAILSMTNRTLNAQQPGPGLAPEPEPDLEPEPEPAPRPTYVEGVARMPGLTPGDPAYATVATPGSSPTSSPPGLALRACGGTTYAVPEAYWPALSRYGSVAELLIMLKGFTPGGTIVLLRGTDVAAPGLGPELPAGGPCPGLKLGLVGPGSGAGFGLRKINLRADENGFSLFERTGLGPYVDCDAFVFQAIDMATCAVSGVLSQREVSAAAGP